MPTATTSTTQPFVVPGQTTTTTTTPGQLALSSGTVDFGSTATSRTVTLSNPGGQPMAWSSMQGPAGFLGSASPFSISPASGTLNPGQAATITITLSRSRALTEALELSPRTITFFAGSVFAQVTAIGAYPPEINIVEQPATPSCIRSQNGLFFAIDIFDFSAPTQSGNFSPQLVVRTPDGQTASDAFSPDGFWYGGVSFTQFPSFPTPGNFTWTITVFDTVGNSATWTGTVSLLTELC